MKISTDTISLLKNFANINGNILVKPGNKITTISTMKNILAEAEIKESFDSEFAIYDLSEFLRSLDLFDDPELKITNSNVVITDSKSNQSIRYVFADKSVIISPTKTIKIPDKEVTFTLKKEDLAKLMKGSTTLNLVDIALQGDGKKIKLVATDKKNKSSNEFGIDVGETDKIFKAYFKSENLKMMEGEYDVAISKAKISHFINKSKPVQYWIALEPDSEF